MLGPGRLRQRRVRGRQLPAAGGDAPAPHPIRLVVTDDLSRSRLTVFFRLLLFIPLAIWAGLWGIAVCLAVFVAWIVGIFTGRVPDGLHGFLASYTRSYTHISAYIWIAADPYRFRMFVAVGTMEDVRRSLAALVTVFAVR